jgi:glycosyltransferase involved in cell wall biosynthesis
VGELAQPESAASMAQAIRRLYERDPDVLGANARERALQRFTWSHALQLQLASYARVFGSMRDAATPRRVMEFGSPHP